MTVPMVVSNTARFLTPLIEKGSYIGQSVHNPLEVVSILLGSFLLHRQFSFWFSDVLDLDLKTVNVERARAGFAARIPIPLLFYGNFMTLEVSVMTA